jgi:transcriptional regulator with XRE-family HTH domain
MTDEMSTLIRAVKIERFGEKLRQLREQRGLNVVELAHILGYASTNQIYFLETGKRNPTAELAVKVSKLFGVSTDDLLDDARELPAP